jgi:hypothetical protein
VPEPLTHYRTSVEDSARWLGFRFRPGDIVISAPSKTGTTWTQMICALLVFQTPDLPAPLTTLSPWMDMRVRPASQVHAHLEAQTHRRFIKTHTPLDGVPADERATYLAVGRHPLDVAVSLRHQGKNLDRDVIRRLLDEPGESETGSTSLAATTDERAGLLRWMDNDEPVQENLDTLRGLVWQTSRAWQRREERNVFLVHYSDLSANLEREMRRIAELVEIHVPERTWPELVDAATFALMKKRSADLVPDERLGIMKSTDAFFRRGSGGEWRQWLTEDDLARYDRRLTELAEPDLASWLHHGRSGSS